MTRVAWLINQAIYRQHYTTTAYQAYHSVTPLCNLEFQGLDRCTKIVTAWLGQHLGVPPKNGSTAGGHWNPRWTRDTNSDFELFEFLNVFLFLLFILFFLYVSFRVLSFASRNARHVFFEFPDKNIYVSTETTTIHHGSTNERTTIEPILT